MLILTEDQRVEAIAICERIEAANDRMQAVAKEALATLDRLSRNSLPEQER